MWSDSWASAPYTNHSGAATDLLVGGEQRIFVAFPHVWHFPTISGMEILTGNLPGNWKSFYSFPQITAEGNDTSCRISR